MTQQLILFVQILYENETPIFFITFIYVSEESKIYLSHLQFIKISLYKKSSTLICAPEYWMLLSKFWHFLFDIFNVL